MRPGTIVDERYVIRRLVGEGGMGEVYQAVDRTEGRPVALKLLASEQVRWFDRFEREGDLLARLRHPAIVTYLGDGVTEAGRRYLVMEWLDGVDLAAFLRARRLTLSEAVLVLQRAAEALACAHAAGVVHRDIKPTNLFVVGHDLAALTLIDFGIAHDQEALSSLTSTGARIGTPGYMSPEQIRGEPRIGPAADVFSLGCVIYEGLAGRRAFRADHAIAVHAKILLEDVPPVGEVCPTVPPALERLITRMMSKAAGDRPADGAELLSEIAALNEQEPGRSPARAALSGGEQRLVSVLVAATSPSTMGAAHGVTLADDGDTARRGTVEAVLQRARAHVEHLADGTLVATMRGRGGPASDEAARAARAALELRGRMPDLDLALATGRSVPAGRLPIGEAIDRAVDLLQRLARRPALAPRPILLDEVSAGLLEPRFELVRGELGVALSAPRPAFAAPRTVLGVATPMCGRARVVGHLEATLEECAEERVARVVLVTGPAGIGKSRLASELLARERDRGRAQLWTAEGEEATASSPYELVARALRRHFAIAPDQDPIDRNRVVRAALAGVLAGDELARTATFAGEICGRPLPADQAPPELEAARGDPALMADQVRRAVVTCWRSLADRAPIALVVDDVHWADAPSVRLIDAALRALRERPFLVLALGRPDARQRLADVWRERAVEEIQLGGLPRSAQERLVRSILGDEVDAALVARLVEQSSGNAFYLEELVRAAALGREAAPETVIAMVEARLDELPVETRRLLRAASVFGERFSAAGARALLGRTGGEDEGVADRLAALVDAELVLPAAQEATAAGPGDYRFRHALVRQAAYGTLTARDRATGHALAGAWLEERGGADPVVLAEHFERGELPGRAIAQYRRAARRALETQSFETVSRAVERALACGAVGDDLDALREAQLEALQWAGKYEAVLGVATEFLASQVRGSAGWFRAVRKVSSSAYYLADRHYPPLLARMLIETPLAGEGITDGAIAQCMLYDALRNAGQFELADRLADHVEPAAERVPPAAGLMIRRLRRRGAAELESWTALCAVHEAAGDARRAAQMRVNIGYRLTECGAYAEAEELLRTCVDSVTRLEIPGLIPHARANLGYCLGRQRRLAEAMPMLREAIERLSAQRDTRLEIGSRTHLAMVLLVNQRHAEAMAEIAPALPLTAGALTMRPVALAIFAAAGRALGDPSSASAADEAHALLDRCDWLEDGEPLVRLERAEALLASGRTDEARVAARAARDHVLEQAALLRDEEHRRCFTGAVWENRRALELAAELGAG